MGDWRAGGGEAEPLGSAADVEETWLPGNCLVTKEAMGLGGERSTRKAASKLLLQTLAPRFLSWTYITQQSLER